MLIIEQLGEYSGIRPSLCPFHFRKPTMPLVHRVSTAAVHFPEPGSDAPSHVSPKTPVLRVAPS